MSVVIQVALAVPSIIFIAQAKSIEFKSGIFSFATSLSCSKVKCPTLSL
jgi:hypothetical protein